MNRYWMLGAMGVVLLLGNTGCYLDQLQATQRDNRILREDLARVENDLQAERYMNQQKDTQIGSLRNELAAKDAFNKSQEAQIASLEQSLAGAQRLLEEQAGKGAGAVTILTHALPERLHNELEAFAKQHPDVVTYDPKTGSVRWKAELLFPLGDDRLVSGNEEASEALRKFAAIVASDAASGFDVIVCGHTCNTPIRKAATLAEHKSNWHLSAHRSISVMKMLSEQQVAMSRMGVMGYGEYRPIASNASNDGKTKNRRVEIYLVPSGQVQAFSRSDTTPSNDGIAGTVTAGEEQRGG